MIFQKFAQYRSALFIRYFNCSFLSCLLLVAGPVVAQDQGNASLLWKISGSNLKEPSYLYGTIHALCPQDLQLTAAMLVAMEQSKQLALEVNIDSPAEIQQLQAGMQLQSPQNLNQHLTANEYQLVERFYRDSLNLTLGQLQVFKPLFIASLIYPKLLECPVISYEQQLVQMMREQNKTVVGLERAAEHIKVMDAIPYQEQARMLFESVKRYDELKAEYWNMVVSYKNRDLQTLYEVVRETTLGLKSYEKPMLTDRNRRWIPAMESLARSKATFFAVGAAHLPGPEGLISLLQKRGYTLEPLEL